MTNPRDDLVALAPCPFCGGEAERLDQPEVDIDPDFGTDPALSDGGSCITCTRCVASTALHFGRKENLYSSWNTRAASRPAPVDREAVALADLIFKVIKFADAAAGEGICFDDLDPATILSDYANAIDTDCWEGIAEAVRDQIISLLRPAKAWDSATSPGMTDLMVSPESLDAFMEANPLPTPDAVGEPVAWDHRVLCACENCTEHAPENSVFAREDIGVMPDGTWLCENCYSDCEKTAYGMVANDIDDFEYPRFEDLPRPSLYTHPPKSPDISATVLAERERCAIEARQYVSAHGHHCFWGGSVIDYGWDKEKDKRMRKFIGDIALGVEKAIRQLPTERGE